MHDADDTEQLRLKELKSFGVLDTLPEADFDRLTRLVARICNVPIAMVSLVDGERQWFKSSVGLDVRETDRNISFCTHAIQGAELFVVPDAQSDVRFSSSPLVTGEPHIRFYAGMPLISNGHALGTLCAIDKVPRTLTEQQKEALQLLAAQVMMQLELRRQSGSLASEFVPDYEVETLFALSRTNRAYKMLLSCNEAMIRTQEEDALLHAICRLIVEVGGYRMAWVGYAQDDDNKSILPMAHYGRGGDLIEQANLSWSEHQPKGRGPAGRCIRSGQPVVSADITQDPTYPILELALQQGFHGMASLPLRYQGRVMGALMLYSADVLHMPQQELSLLQQMADDLTFGIMNIRAQQEQRRIQLAMAKVAAMVSVGNGTDIFQQLALNMVEALGADGGAIARLAPEGVPTTAHTMAAVLDGKLIDNFDYALEGTPCNELIKNEECLVPIAASVRYPQDILFGQLGVEAYACVRIRNAKFELIGIASVFFRRPLQRSEAIIATLKIFATRAAAEIERQTTEAEIQHLAFYDSLTQLPNRQLLHDRLQQALLVSGRNKRLGAVLFIDLDNFKALNDTLGHDVGDLLLQQVAARLNLCVRESDTVARLGGDEFVLLLEEISDVAEEAATHARIVGEKILAGFSAPYVLGAHEHHCTPSIGITLFGDQAGSVDDVLKNADMAMYQAKNAGRNALRFFEPAMQAAISLRVATEKGLHQALQKNQFVLHFQPQLDDEGKLQSAEALVRWQHPENGEILPATFIALAEETGLISDIGQWVLQAACTKLAEWAEQEDLAHINLSVNVSPRQFHHPDFLAQVLTSLKSTGANPHRLKLELTEGLLVDNVEDTIAKMESLKAEGVSFSLDDFGTGYSSLAYLKRLPLSQLKIDQFFVKDLLTNANNSAIIRTIIALGYSLGLQVMAEGVESKSQREYLKRLSCYAYQGFFLSPPLPVDEFEAFVRDMLASTS